MRKKINKFIENFKLISSLSEKVELANSLELDLKNKISQVNNLELDLKNKISQVDSLLRVNKNLHKELSSILDSIDVSVDVHEHSRSWACISLQGTKQDYIKFVDLGDSQIREISNFLRRYEGSNNIKIDAHPSTSMILKNEFKKINRF